MNYRKAAPSTRSARVLLVCIFEARLSRTALAPRPHALEANGAALLDRWEKAELPVVFASPALEPERSLSRTSTFGGREVEIHSAIDAEDDRWPSRTVAFRPDTPSLLRCRGFNRLFEGLGGPLLILLGDQLGDVVMETAIDGFLSGHPIIIVKDAAPQSLGDVEAISSSRAKSLPLLSCFARLMGTNELLREWTAPRTDDVLLAQGRSEGG
jgi:hypothetical protein